MTRLPYLLGSCTPRQSISFLDRMAEKRSVDLGILGWFGIQLSHMQGGEKPQKMEVYTRNQGVGEFCGGSCIKECTAHFGESVLPLVCKTCPD